MWTILNNAFLSIVENREDSNELLVRSRVNGDIEKIFPKANVFQDKLADYKYRSFINRKEVASAIYNEIMKIDYDNFKNSVPKTDSERLSAYGDVWSVLLKLQKY